MHLVETFSGSQRTHDTPCYAALMAFWIPNCCHFLPLVRKFITDGDGLHKLRPRVNFEDSYVPIGIASQLYRDRIVPAAKQNVESARAGYTAGKVDFLRLIEAQRQLINLREEQVETVSNYHRRRAELERAAAVPIEIQETSTR